MTSRDFSKLFLLDLAHRDFAEGKAPYPVKDAKGTIRFLALLVRGALGTGAALTAVTLGIFFYQSQAHDRLLASVQTVQAKVSGCEGPGRFQNVRFQYMVNGAAYDQSAYWQRSAFTGPSGLIDACAAGTVSLRYLASDPNRWAIAPLSPIRRDELTGGISGAWLVAGPMLLLIAGIFGLTRSLLRKRQARNERLRDHGVILDAELIKAEPYSDEDSHFNLRCEYRFTNPEGVTVTGRTLGLRPDIKKKNLPPPGTHLLVLYADPQTHEAI